jgi:hypothetical protein
MIFNSITDSPEKGGVAERAVTSQRTDAGKDRRVRSPASNYRTARVGATVRDQQPVGTLTSV